MVSFLKEIKRRMESKFSGSFKAAPSENFLYTVSERELL